MYDEIRDIRTAQIKAWLDNGTLSLEDLVEIFRIWINKS